MQYVIIPMRSIQQHPQDAHTVADGAREFVSNLLGLRKDWITAEGDDSAGTVTIWVPDDVDTSGSPLAFRGREVSTVRAVLRRHDGNVYGVADHQVCTLDGFIDNGDAGGDPCPKELHAIVAVDEAALGAPSAEPDVKLQQRVERLETALRTAAARWPSYVPAEVSIEEAHGHVRPRADGRVARCPGKNRCKVCEAEWKGLRDGTLPTEFDAVIGEWDP